ncbi:flagellar biosynthesis protein FlhB [Virgibacillus halodenitrificans]|uniref:Flagellar biosynthetic protein FlhB n=2 Tax=Virgibacillus halodenitrificans TaxID=1482 RepID=A0AAC9IZF8_VIRHA|nr:flagellar biosynthesis protein FlhB [Virgibacillus halodenitrificans]APC48616.1 flagellar biosynthesis protein FlhB [Virgibacillus halodenitrificans]MCG1028716.1 flagellar biosynthesis protein FlhB [Virgibacillus halodenitrificans]MCJ0931190.1 flagellar biosynthesis protein FlhB [Virgibacillus halodenitrificans]MEC2160315.1 flagellar biosynthesis protein FlhB [Virgibacillus halodenitrificans]MYL45978.1 flagellar biosynthesis protein FlhB [Virgibacillus halodenitrificans]
MQLRMDLQFFAGEKTEKATPKKRQDERKKGKVAKSQDINTAILLLFSFMILVVFGSSMKNGMTSLYEHTFTEFIHWDVTEETVHRVFSGATIEAAKFLAPIMIIAIVAGLTSNFMQIGFLFTTEPLKLDLKKIDPIQGAKRIFSVRALVELAKSLLKIVFIGVITFLIIWMFKDDMLMLAFKNAENALGFFGRTTIIMGITAAFALLLLSVFDYAYQRYDFEKNMKMSKQDIKDEYKNMEGDPLIKSKIKEKQKQMATRRMMSEVPQADVVITNPTHFAIAIKYDEKKANAPYILAKGVDQVALKIKEVAKANDVVTVENRPLARALYGATDIGDVIPEDFFQAVAEILAYVYKLERKV